MSIIQLENKFCIRNESAESLKNAKIIYTVSEYAPKISISSALTALSYYTPYPYINTAVFAACAISDTVKIFNQFEDLSFKYFSEENVLLATHLTFAALTGLFPSKTSFAALGLAAEFTYHLSQTYLPLTEIYNEAIEHIKSTVETNFIL
ncbi:MAG: hypothetical protein ACK4OM_04420 [Alphaproteobacteria bacterium]